MVQIRVFEHNKWEFTCIFTWSEAAKNFDNTNSPKSKDER